MIRKFKLPDNGIPIRVGQSSFIYKDVYHPIEWRGGEPHRPRVETLVLRKSGIDVVYMEYKKENRYRIPGGSIDSDSTFEKQAENETNEEALLSVSDIAFANVVYYQEMDKDYIAKGGDSCIPYVGSVTHVYTAYMSGHIEKNTIEEKDLDNKMAENGKFYPIRSVVNILRVDHIKALINSGRIRDKGLESMLYTRLQQLMVEQPPTTVFETPCSGEMETKYIYHGSAHDFDVFHPMSLDLGNADQKPGWSTFCFREYALARRFALMRLIQKTMEGKEDKYHVCGWDLKENKPFLHHTVYAEVLNAIRYEKIFVYTVDATPLALGVGNDERFPEITFREDNVIPYKKDVIFTEEDTIRDDIHVIRKDPNVYEQEQMDDLANLNRGWVTCMLNRDYSGDNAVAKLTKAVSDGKLNPGDDVVSYMNANGISLKDISFIERLHDAVSVAEEGFDLSESFEETIYLGDHKALITSEKKEGKYVFNYDCMNEDEKFSEIPTDVNTIHKAFLYEIQRGGTLQIIGWYRIYELGLLDEDEIYKPQKYLLHLAVAPDYRKFGVGSVLLNYAIRYYKKNLSCPLMAEVLNCTWEKTGIRKWVKSFTTSNALRSPGYVVITIDNVDDIATESCEQNLSNLSWYHAEIERSGFNPKFVSGWDAELYSKTIDHAIKQTFMGAVGKDKSLLDKKSFTMHMYTAGEELSPIYLGKVTMYYYGLEDNGYIPKCDWEWAEQEDFGDAFLSNLKEEVHPHLMEGVVPVEESLIESVDIENVSDSDDIDIVEEGMVDTSLSPVFIVCTFTGTRFGKIVTKIQDCKFSHSGLALDSDLKKIYTYNMLAKAGGGAGIESIDMYKNVSTGGDGDVCVMCFFVPTPVKDKIKQVVEYVFSNVNKTSYAFSNLINILVNRAVDTKNSLQMVCSQFVDFCLKAANVDLTKKSSNLVSPNDFANIPKSNPKVFVLFDGKKSEYNRRKAENKIHRLLRSREPEELNVVVEGIELLEACKNIEEARKFVRDVERLAKKYDANYFIVTDGASGTSNKGNPAVKHPRDSQIEWDKKHGFDPDEDWTDLYESMFPLKETVIFNKDNTEYNVDKFESGKSNIILVTGLSGSGKSTLGEKIANKYHATLITLDNFEFCHEFPTEGDLKKYAGEVFYEYLDARRSLWEKLKNKELTQSQMCTEISHFVHYCIKWCRKHKDKKWVIEGVQIYSFLRGDEAKQFPLIILGTSMKNSVLQRFKRNGGGTIEWGKELKNEFSNLIKWYWDEEKTLSTFKKEAMEVNGLSLPEGFRLPEQGEFKQYMHLADLDAARESIPDDVMEGWLMTLMEADRDKKDKNGLPSLGKDDKTEDYSSDAEQEEEDDDTDENTENITDNTDDEDDETEDYTSDAEDDEEGEEPEAEDDSEEPQQDDDSEPDDLDAGGNDYTSDADSSSDTDGGSDDTSGDSDEDYSGGDTDQETNTQSNNNGVKNHSLLCDFESLYRLASEISDTIEPIIMEKPIQNKVLTQVRANLTTIKSALMNFITTHFKADDYPFNLYHYEVFMGLLSKNLKILQKNKEFSSKDAKRNEKKEKE